MPEPQHIDPPEEAVEGVPGLKQARDAFDVAYFGHGRSWQDALTLALLFVTADIRKQERERLGEELQPILRALDLEIERCQELGDIWAFEGVDADFPSDPDDRARFFHGQRDKLKELRRELAALDAEDSE